MTLGCDTCLGQFQVDAIPLVAADPRWCAYDLRPLTDSQNHRGTDTLIPLAPGEIDNPRRFAPTSYLLPFAITGWVDDGGYEIGPEGADARAVENWREIRTLLVGQRTFVYVEPDGTTWTGTGHVLDLDQASFGQGIWDGSLDILLTQPWVIT